MKPGNSLPLGGKRGQLSDAFDEPLLVASVGRLAPRFFKLLSQLPNRHALEQSDFFVDVDLH
jgi:hypothetical protein